MGEDKWSMGQDTNHRQLMCEVVNDLWVKTQVIHGSGCSWEWSMVIDTSDPWMKTSEPLVETPIIHW